MVPVEDSGFQKVLVATDFSSSSDAAFRQSLWAARQSGGSVVLAHVIEDLHRAAHAMSYKAKQDLLSGEGRLFEKEIRYFSDQKLRIQMASFPAEGVAVSFESLLGDAFVEIIHAVQQEGHDLVIAGTHGRTLHRNARHEFSHS